MFRQPKPISLVLLVVFLICATPLALADSPGKMTSADPQPNGAERPAVFTRWARVVHPSWTYDAPSGNQAAALDDWDTWLSIKDSTSVGGQTWYRTSRGTWVSANDVRIMGSSEFQGVQLDGTEQGVLGFVMENNTRVLSQPDGNAKMLGTLDRYTPVGVIGVDNGYLRIADGQWVSPELVRVVKPMQRPAGVAPGDKWIDVNLTQQTLTAYEGDTPVFATLISSGKGLFPTKRGLYPIYEKLISHTMASGSSMYDPSKPKGENNDPYTLDEVPWSMYFTERYALHGAYWHDMFGEVRSHGCVNLTPADAKWLFTWTGPEVPAGQNAAYSSVANPGTWVWVHD
ncbi:MAG: L,D-transpeptidase [Anaerolineae bacterium]